MLTCEFIQGLCIERTWFIESHLQRCPYFLMKLSINLVACIINRENNPITIMTPAQLLNFIIAKDLFSMDDLSHIGINSACWVHLLCVFFCRLLLLFFRIECFKKNSS